MIRIRSALIVASAVVALTGCAMQPEPSASLLSPSQNPELSAPSESPATDACTELTAADVAAAISALPGWWYDFWSSSEVIDGSQHYGAHASAEYIAPDRLRSEAEDPYAVRHGQIFVVDRVWTYAGVPESASVDPAVVAKMMEFVFPFRGPNFADQFPFPGDLPGDGLRGSPRVLDTECLATDPNTGTSMVTTRSGQLVRMTSEKRLEKFVELKTLLFHATMPPSIEPPSAADLKTTPFFADQAKPGRADPR